MLEAEATPTNSLQPTLGHCSKGHAVVIYLTKEHCVRSAS
jgi:hypothetical protein